MEIKETMKKIIDWILYEKTPKPNLDPRAILEEMGKDPLMNSEDFRKGEKSLSSDQITIVVGRKQSIALVQKGLIALGLIKIDTTKEGWWRKPRSPYSDAGGGFAWGSYGPKTVNAVEEFQKIAGIEGRNGHIFGEGTLVALKAALRAKAEGKDWKAAARNAVYNI